METKKKFRNDLLKRNEIVIVNEYDSNPGFEKTKSDLASGLKVDAENIVIRRVGSHFGSNEFVVEAFVYDSPEDLAKVEPKKKEKKKAGV